MLFWILFVIIFLPSLILFPVKKVGKKNLKELNGKNYIIACNHMSGLDPVLMDLKLGKRLRFLAKKELLKNKFNAIFMREFGAVGIDRGQPDPRAIKTIFKLISKKKSICIFPQGTRKKQPYIEEGTAKEGVAMFAIRTGTPVVPMMFDRKIKLFRRAKLLIGKPIYPDLERKKDKDYLLEFSNTLVNEMNNLLKGEDKK